MEKQKIKPASKEITISELKIILKRYGSPLIRFTEKLKRSRSYFQIKDAAQNRIVPLKIVDELIEYVGVENYNSLYENYIIPRRNEIAERQELAKQRKEMRR